MTIPEKHIFEITFHEAINTYANPYGLWIQIYIPDERFYFYLKDICATKRVVIYEIEDPFIKKITFGNAGKKILVDRVSNLLKAFNGQVYEKDVTDVDLTENMQFSFSTEKERANFKKQFQKGVRTLILFEYKNYIKILKEMGITLEINNLIGEQAQEIDSIQDVYESHEYSQEPLLLDQPKKSKMNFFKK